MADDPLASGLDEIRNRAALAYASPARTAESAADVPRLLAALEAVLKPHRRSPHPAWGAGTGDCHGKHFCLQCSIDGVYRPWPCQPYHDAARELLGEEAGMTDEHPSGLNETARTAIADAGITVTAYMRAQGYMDGEWGGDACGCPDDRCTGFHHGSEGECGCLRVLLDEMTARAPSWDGGNDGRFPDGSDVEVRYPRDDQQAHGDRDQWPWFAAVIECQAGIDEWLVRLTAPELLRLADDSPATEDDLDLPICNRDSGEIRKPGEESGDG